MAQPVSSIAVHPQRDKIIEALAAGTKLREISAWANPPVSLMALSRYRNAANIQTTKALTAANAALSIQGATMTAETVQAVNRAALTTAIDPFVATALRSAARRERWMDDLEAQPDVDSYRVLATLDKNDLAAQEYHARLAGRLDVAQGSQTNNLHVYVSIPRGDQEQASLPAQPAIDIERPE